METTRRSFTGEEARRLARACAVAALGTLQREGGGPYVSLANVAGDPSGRPIVLISRLAWHTQNLVEDARAALLFTQTAGYADPLAGPRVTFLGRFEPVRDVEAVRRRYLARHPAAGMYADFADFAFHRMQVEEVHAVAGFGRIETLPAGEVLLGEAEYASVAAAESAIIEHMNRDHAEAVSLCATRLLGAKPAAWRIGACDCDGCDLSDATVAVRLAFPGTARSPEEVRNALIELARRARAA